MSAADEFYWAASELYITTGNSTYLSRIDGYTLLKTDFGWPETAPAGAPAGNGLGHTGYPLGSGLLANHTV